MSKLNLISFIALATLSVLMASACSSGESAESTLPSNSIPEPSSPQEIVEDANFELPAQFPPPESPPPEFFDIEIVDLKSIDAVGELHFLGEDGEDLCNDRLAIEKGGIPDYAERELGSLVPVVSPELAGRYAIGAAAVVYKSYEATYTALGNPEARQLLCISRLISQPRLEKDWNILTYYIRNNKTLRGATLPFRIATAGVRTGEAFVAGCFNANPYGTTYDENGRPQTQNIFSLNHSFLFQASLAWIGGRWRVQTITDHEEMTCDDLDQLISELHDQLQIDIEAGFNWILSSETNNWNWTKKEIIKWTR